MYGTGKDSYDHSSPCEVDSVQSDDGGACDCHFPKQNALHWYGFVMNITFLCKRTLQLGIRCPTFSIVPGEEIDVSAELKDKLRVNGRVVKDVPHNRVLLLDTCCGGRLKAVYEDCQFFVPTNDDEWEAVKPILKELAERRVLVLSEIDEQIDLLDIKEQCRKSFYLQNGQLINKKFEQENLTPEKMAEAGLMFVGDRSRDNTSCYFEAGHLFRDWGPSDEPKARHFIRYRYLCVDDQNYKTSILSDADGQKVPVQAYKVNMRPVPSGHNCSSAILVTHFGAPVKLSAWSDIVSPVEAATLARIESSIQVNTATGITANRECFELLKQSIYIASFSSLLRDYHCVSHGFISQLQDYKNELHSPAELTTADALLEKLSLSTALRAEVMHVVNKLAALRLVKEIAGQLACLPSAMHKAVISAMELCAAKELQEFAGSYEQRFFINDCLNGLVKDGSLGCLFTSGYFNAPERCEKLMSLLAKGTEFLHILVSISEAIKESLEPFTQGGHQGIMKHCQRPDD